MIASGSFDCATEASKSSRTASSRGLSPLGALGAAAGAVTGAGSGVVTAGAGPATGARVTSLGAAAGAGEPPPHATRSTRIHVGRIPLDTQEVARGFALFCAARGGIQAAADPGRIIEVDLGVGRDERVAPRLG